MDQGQHNQSFGQRPPGNQYPQYGYAHYDQPEEQKTNLMDKIFGPEIGAKLRSPLVATIALLAAGAVFAGVIVMSYPSGEEETVPVVTADVVNFKQPPAERGGMEVPNEDSTIFTQIRSGELDEDAPVENLLAQEEPVDKLEAFAQEAEELMKEEAPETKIVAKKEGDTVKIEEVTEAEEPPALEKIAAKTESKKVQKIAVTTEKIPPQEIAASKQPPEKIHAAGSSPETLAFVRSVLDKKDDPGTAAANGAANIEPAAGAATSAGVAIAPGEYFVQLASVPSRQGAENEWPKLQKKFTSELQNVAYRIQEANLGERGTYYRIQAGPMSRESADQICDTIKAQKPGGCLVVR